MNLGRQYSYWLGLCFAFFFIPLLSANCDWQGPSAINHAAWDTPSNWSCGVVPTVTDDADFPAGGSYFFTGDISTPARMRTYGSVTINVGVNLNVMKLAVFSNLANNGNITFNGNNKTSYRITIHSGATLTNSSSGTIDLEDDTRNGIRVSGGAGFTNDGNIMVNVPADNNAIWVEENGSYGGSGVMNIISGEVLCEGQCLLLLPVELTQFNGRESENKNLLSWVTATEQNASHFLIECRNSENNNWREIGRVEAVGNSTVENYYSFKHEAENKLTYYRLRILDWDGSIEYSPVISINNQSINAGSGWSVFPTSAKEVIFIKTPEEDFIFSELNIFSMEGRLAKTVALNNNNDTILEIKIGDMAPGAYFFQLGKSEVHRFFVMN